jgi:ech hydrogenase subunit D
MDREAFLARVGEYHKEGRRLALINVTTVIPVAAPVHGAAAPAAAAPAAAPAPAESTAAAEAPASPAPDTFEISWVFENDKDASLEKIREQVSASDAVPSISDFFGAAFLYENEMRELFGINVEGINLDLGGQLYKTVTKIPFSHAAVKARLEALAAKTAEAAAAKAATPATATPAGAAEAKS